MGDLSQNFSKKEFECKCGCGHNNINTRLINKLQRARTDLNKPIEISSGCRCNNHNSRIGGFKNSTHLDGLAVDIICSKSKKRLELLTVLMRYFNRIGVSNQFIHVDIGIGIEEPQDVLWIY